MNIKRLKRNIATYGDFEIKQVLNSWAVKRKPVGMYQPDHNYHNAKPVPKEKYGIAVKIFRAEAEKHDLVATPISKLNEDRQIWLVDGRYSIAEILGWDNDLNENSAFYL